MRVLRPGGEPFYYPGGDVGCLLVHGFPGAPEEMRWLGEHLAAQGFSVVGIRLFGHGTQPGDLRRARFSDWAANVEDGYQILRGSCSQIVLMGFSLGGVLSLVLAPRLDIHGLVIMAAPIELPPLARRLRPFLPLLTLFWRYRRPGEPSDWRDQQAEALNVHYPVQPVRTIGEVYDLVELIRASTHSIHVPTLLIYSHGDGSVPAEHAERILAGVAAQDKRIQWLENSGHCLPRDAERERVFAACEAFIQRITSEATP
jgi:carboxylesterase